MSTNVTLCEIKKHIKEMVENVDININKVIIFGSTARDERTSDSDTDLIILSEDYPEKQIYERVARFYKKWDSTEYGPVDFLCLKPEEWKKKKNKENSVYEDAEKEGIVLNY